MMKISSLFRLLSQYNTQSLSLTVVQQSFLVKYNWKRKMVKNLFEKVKKDSVF